MRPAALQRWRIMVAGSRAGLATEHAAEHGSGLVAVHRVTGSAALGEELLAVDGIRRGVGLEPRKVLGLIGLTERSKV